MTGKARGGLGRGLAALIPTGPTTTTVADVLINGSPAKREGTATVPGHVVLGHVVGGEDRHRRPAGDRTRRG